MIRILKMSALGLAMGVAAVAAVILGEEYVESRRVAPNAFAQIDQDSTPAATRLKVYVDPVTRCEYLAPVWSNSILVPRVAGDGRTHFGCGSVIPREVLSRR